jgi:hypothetical protein
MSGEPSVVKKALYANARRHPKNLRARKWIGLLGLVSGVPKQYCWASLHLVPSRLVMDVFGRG